MLNLVGVDHSVQHNGRAAYPDEDINRLRSEFRSYLQNCIIENQVVIVAVESNAEVLEKFNATESVPKLLADANKIKHIFCEPSLDDRRHLGITNIGNTEDYEKREKVWLQRILPYKGERILLILGAEHISSFSMLAESSGFSLNTIEPYFCREYFAP